jgi:hypothetical protein
MDTITLLRRVFVGALAVVLATLATGGAAWAQRYPWSNGDFRLTTEGRGEIRMDGRGRDDIRRVFLFLRRDGRAEVTLYQERGQTSLSGRWRDDGEDRDGNPRLNLELEGRYDGYRADGRGPLLVRRKVQGLGEQWILDNLELRGRADGRDLEVRFRGDGPGTPGTPDGDFSGGYGDLTQFNSTARGFGTVREGSNRWDVDRLYVRLDRGGRADITSYGRTTVRYEGRWRRVREREVELRIDRAFGSDVRDGRGRIELTRDRRDWIADRIELNGRTNRDDFSLNFSSRDSGGGEGGNAGGSGGAVEVDSSRSGRGRIRWDNRSDVPVRRVSVNLNRAGRAQIVAESESGARYTFSGRWTRNREGEFRIEIVSALNTNNATGRGTLYLRGRDLDRLDIEGTAQSQTYRFDFSAD